MLETEILICLEYQDSRGGGMCVSRLEPRNQIMHTTLAVQLLLGGTGTGQRVSPPECRFRISVRRLCRAWFLGSAGSEE